MVRRNPENEELKLAERYSRPVSFVEEKSVGSDITASDGRVISRCCKGGGCNNGCNNDSNNGCKCGY